MLHVHMAQRIAQLSIMPVTSLVLHCMQEGGSALLSVA